MFMTRSSATWTPIRGFDGAAIPPNFCRMFMARSFGERPTWAGRRFVRDVPRILAHFMSNASSQEHATGPT